ncbi:hypothetical protein AAC387_Pa01g2197 [Persea americana]
MVGGWHYGGDEKWRLIWPFFFILFLHSVAILLFTRGFLLIRTELSAFSQCSDISFSPCSPPPPPQSNTTTNNNNNNNNNYLSLHHHHCWTKSAVDHVVIIVLDTLRSHSSSSPISFLR